MKKYAPLHDYLCGLDDDSWSTTFTEIEQVLRFTLPPSARQHRPWWGNQNKNSGHSHAMAWANAGWKTTNVDLVSETLTFIRVAAEKAPDIDEGDHTSIKPASVQQRVIRFIESAKSAGATNREISTALDRSPSHISQETALLERRGLIRSEQEGKAKRYFLATTELQQQAKHKSLTPAAFEQYARELFSEYFQTSLNSGKVEGIPKIFDLVSADGSIVGDAKYYSMVGGQAIPPAKFSVIAEYVWMLEKTEARKCFLVFGNDRRVPEEWLKRYRDLVESVEFYFVTEDGEIIELA